MRLALRILPPSDPITNTFLLDLLWLMLKALTGITTPSFFLKIENPLMGFLNKVFILFGGASYPSTILGTSQSNILPSVANESKL